MRPWYKRWPTGYPPEFFLCSERGRLLFHALLDACGMREQHDGLAIVAETVLHLQTAIPPAKLRLAFAELAQHGLIIPEGVGYRVPLFSWMQRKVDDTHAQRQATYRGRERDARSDGELASPPASRNGKVTPYETPSDGTRSIEVRESPSTVPSEPPTPTTAKDKPPRRPRAPKQEADWVTPLRAQAEALRRRQLADLNPDERFIVARYHGVVFAFLSRNESGNITKAGGIATSLSYLVDTLERRRIEMTVAQYFALARKYHAKIGEAPWYTPTRVQAVMQVEAV